MAMFKLFIFFPVTTFGILFQLFFLNLAHADVEVNPQAKYLRQIQNELIACKKSDQGAVTPEIITVDGVQREVKLSTPEKCALLELKYRGAFSDFLLTDEGQQVIKLSIIKDLNLLLKHQVTSIAGININELMGEINEIKSGWVNGVSALKPNNKNPRGSGVCLPSEDGFLVSIPDFANMGYDFEKLSGLVLHEILCSIPLKQEKSFWQWGDKEINRKYDDLHYQKSSLIIIYSRLIEEGNKEKIKFFETHWLKTDPKQEVLWLADGSGGISGGPGGGNSHALWLKIYLLQDLLEHQWQCRSSMTEAVKWGKQEIPCEWLFSSWLQRSFIRMRIEEKALDENIKITDYFTNAKYHKQASSVDVSFPFHDSKDELIQKDLLIELGFLYSTQRSYETKENRESIIDKIWGPCFSSKDYDPIMDKIPTCFFH